MEIALKEQIERLDQRRLFGKIVHRRISYLLKLIEGRKVLEIGCGYGFLVELLRREGLDVLGVDVNGKSLKVGRSLFPDANLRWGDAYRLKFPDDYFETIIYHEVVHHLDWPRTLFEASRVVKKSIIIFDPNPNFLVRFCRKLIRHKDEKIEHEKVIDVLKKNNFRIDFFGFSDVLAFPLSGGFVAPEICPKVEAPQRAILTLDNMLNSVLKICALQKYFCWRYLIKATKI